MAEPKAAVAMLLSVPSLPHDARRGFFRQALGAIAQETAESGANAFLQAPADDLLRATERALDEGWLTEQEPIQSPAVASALYDLSAALPIGQARLVVARLVLAELYRGDAATFVSIAQRMAEGSTRGLAGAGVRARVALAMFLPLSAPIPVDELAYALTTRRDLAQAWVTQPAVGSLPERRLAARVLERACRRVARHKEGILATDRPDLAVAFSALLSDREPLVWRHAATARGLLACVDDNVAQALVSDLAPEKTPTEWRRAAAATGAQLAGQPDVAFRRAMAIVEGPLIMRDPGLAGALVWGLAAAADDQPDAVRELLADLAARAPLPIAESLLDFRAESAEVAQAAIGTCSAFVETSLDVPEADTTLTTLGRVVLQELTDAHGETSPIRSLRADAMRTFAESGAEPALAAAKRALQAASTAVQELEQHGLDTDPQRQLALLRDLDATLFESGALHALLLLDRRGSDENASSPPLDELEERLGHWLLDCESAPSTPHLTLHLRRLRALLHLVDGDRRDRGDDADRRAAVRARLQRTVRSLSARMALEGASPLLRVLAATVGRAYDALVRDGAAEAIDVALHAAFVTPSENILGIVREACRNPEVQEAIGGILASGDVLPHSRRSFVVGNISVIDSLCSDPNVDAALGRFAKLVQRLPPSPGRADHLREACHQLFDALKPLAQARALSALVEPNASSDADRSPLTALELACARIEQLTQSAVVACAGTGNTSYEGRASVPPPAVPPIGQDLASMAARVVDGDAVSIADAIDSFRTLRLNRIPPAIAGVVDSVLALLSELPASRSSAPTSLMPAPLSMPSWLPQRQILGGFYVEGRLGRGNAGTVFLAVRVEDRDDPKAERFALKVPEYNKQAARSLTEAQFLRLFREEAGLLLALPEHDNLARFVTFDAGAKPKPILVMELVRGVRIDQLISSSSLDAQQSLSCLLGLLRGLRAMHDAGIAHLDVKPSNVILRGGSTPVLVDFGLSGRHIRPGCGTGAYGAPEVWGATEVHADSDPRPADIYSFACCAYELWTHQPLFDGPNEMAVLAAHLAHDGVPPPLRPWLDDDGLRPAADLLIHCLQRRAEDRPPVAQVLSELPDHARGLQRRSWPVTPVR